MNFNNATVKVASKEGAVLIEILSSSGAISTLPKAQSIISVSPDHGLFLSAIIMTEVPCLVPPVLHDNSTVLEKCAVVYGGKQGQGHVCLTRARCPCAVGVVGTSLHHPQKRGPTPHTILTGKSGMQPGYIPAAKLLFACSSSNGLWCHGRFSGLMQCRS